MTAAHPYVYHDFPGDRSEFSKKVRAIECKAVGGPLLLCLLTNRLTIIIIRATGINEYRREAQILTRGLLRISLTKGGSRHVIPKIYRGVVLQTD